MKKLITIILILALILPAAALAEEQNPIVGKWSCYFDITKLDPAYQKVMDYLIIIYDLYLFEDGAAYMTSATIPKSSGVPDFSLGALSGVWIGSAQDMSIRVGDNTYKADISEDGYLLLHMTKNLPMAFIRTETTGKMMELMGE